jgi:hypothetical protein
MKRVDVIFLVGLFWLTSACSPSELAISRALEQTREAERATLTSIAETKEAIPTNTPTPTKTPKPTPTETPLPLEILANIKLELADLPDSFFEIDPSELDFSEEEIRSMYLDFDMVVGEIFTFFNEEDINVIMGWTIFINDRLERTAFDIYLNNYAEEFLAEVVAETQGEIIEQSLLTGVNEIGEVSIGIQVVVNVEETPFDMVVDIVYFRRDILVPLIFNMYINGETPVISIHELGKIIDNKIIDALDQ